MQWNTEDKENPKALTSFSEYKDEIRTCIYYAKEQTENTQRKIKNAISDLKEQIQYQKELLKTEKMRNSSHIKGLRASLNKAGFEKAVQNGLVQMKKFIAEHPEHFSKKGDEE